MFASAPLSEQQPDKRYLCEMTYHKKLTVVFRTYFTVHPPLRRIYIGYIDPVAKSQ